MKKIVKDPSFVMLLAVNATLIVFYRNDPGQAKTIVWTYYLQSVILGILNFFRIVTLKNFKTENFTVNGHPVTNTRKTKWGTALFFAFHYGFFHLVYIIFLAGMTVQTYGGSFNPLLLLVAVSGFAISGVFENIRLARLHRENPPNIGTLMFMPYVRIIPMHLLILLGFGSGVGFTGDVFLYFLLLKTVADLASYFITQYVYKGRLNETEGGYI